MYLEPALTVISEITFSQRIFQQLTVNHTKSSLANFTILNLININNTHTHTHKRITCL